LRHRSILNGGIQPIVSLIRGDLFSRLLLLAAAATVPALLVLIYLETELRGERDEALVVSAVRQAGMVSNDVTSIVDGARALALSISQYETVQSFDPACAAPLAALNRSAEQFVTMRVVDEAGKVICASNASALTQVANQELKQIAASVSQSAFQTGIVMPGRSSGTPNLLFSLPFTGANQRRGAIDLGLNLAWLNKHFSMFEHIPGSRITISDRAGTVLAQVPDADDVVGGKLPGSLLDMINATAPGTVRLAGPDGAVTMVGYVPAGLSTSGLFCDVRLDMAQQVKSLRGAERRAYLLMALSLLASGALALFVGQRFVRRPTKMLLAAARALSAGDFQARMPVDAGDRSEFGRIAQAFNDMVEALGRQREESAHLQATLEARVAERTADLQRSRDQLQVALSERAKSEASLAQAQKLQAVGQLAGGIAHDFNNLLTAVIGALELLRIRLSSDDARSLRLVDNALHAADRGGRLTSQLLTFSRRQRLLPVATDLNTVVLGMLSLLTTTLGRDIRVETGLARLLWPALVDPHQVESAILNLALNARDAMPNGGTLRISTSNVTLPHPSAASDGSGLADGTVTPVSPRAGEYVMIRVSDTGIGMPPAVLTRIFEPFFTTKQTGRGSGLGLSQVHGLAAQSGGELRAESQPGLGTSISLLLPRAMTAAARVSGQPDLVQSGQAKLHVLVVDDDADVRRLTGEMLSELGHHPLLVADGDAALAALAENALHEPSQEGVTRIDLLLADYAMPGQNGMEVIAQASRTWPELSAILVTGHADIDGPILVGGQKVLRKPFTMAALASALEGLTVVG
jgi:signal transduction histidine kinase/CheY-like chemotaxis protein